MQLTIRIMRENCTISLFKLKLVVYHSSNQNRGHQNYGTERQCDVIIMLTTISVDILKYPHKFWLDVVSIITRRYLK